MRADEVPGEAALFVHKGGFAELRVETDFAEARDALNTADGVFIEDVIVAEPEFEGKIGAKWNEAMELDEVADGPWCAAKDGCCRGE